MKSNADLRRVWERALFVSAMTFLACTSAFAETWEQVDAGSWGRGSFDAAFNKCEEDVRKKYQQELKEGRVACGIDRLGTYYTNIFISKTPNPEYAGKLRPFDQPEELKSKGSYSSIYEAKERCPELASHDLELMIRKGAWGKYVCDFIKPMNDKTRTLIQIASVRPKVVAQPKLVVTSTINRFCRRDASGELTCGDKAPQTGSINEKRAPEKNPEPSRPSEWNKKLKAKHCVNTPVGMSCTEAASHVKTKGELLNILPEEFSLTCSDGETKFKVSRFGSVFLPMETRAGKTRLLPIISGADDATPSIENTLKTALRLPRRNTDPFVQNPEKLDYNGIEALDTKHEGSSIYTGDLRQGRIVHNPLAKDVEQLSLPERRALNSVLKHVAPLFPYLGPVASRLTEAIDRGDQVAVGRAVAALFLVRGSKEYQQRLAEIKKTPELTETLRVAARDLNLAGSSAPVTKMLLADLLDQDPEAKLMKDHASLGSCKEESGKLRLQRLLSLLQIPGAAPIFGGSLPLVPRAGKASVYAGVWLELALQQNNREEYECAQGLAGAVVSSFDGAIKKTVATSNVLKGRLCAMAEAEYLPQTNAEQAEKISQTVAQLKPATQSVRTHYEGKGFGKIRIVDGVNRDLNKTEEHLGKAMKNSKSWKTKFEVTEAIDDLRGGVKQLDKEAADILKLRRQLEVARSSGLVSDQLKLLEWQLVDRLARWLSNASRAVKNAEDIRENFPEQETYVGFADWGLSAANRELNAHLGLKAEKGFVTRASAPGDKGYAFRELYDWAQAQVPELATNLNRVLQGESQEDVMLAAFGNWRDYNIGQAQFAQHSFLRDGLNVSATTSTRMILLTPQMVARKATTGSHGVPAP